jgi:hypothetical protein
MRHLEKFSYRWEDKIKMALKGQDRRVWTGVM